MEFLRLASGLLLPWLCGAVWLAFLEARLRPGQPGNRLRQAGYGFFVGQALLCLLILAINALMGEVLWGWIASLLLVLAAAAGFGLWRLPHDRQLSATARYPEISGPERLQLSECET